MAQTYTYVPVTCPYCNEENIEVLLADINKFELTFKMENGHRYLYLGDKKISLACQLNCLQKVYKEDGTLNSELLSSLVDCPQFLRKRSRGTKVVS